MINENILIEGLEKRKWREAQLYDKEYAEFDDEGCFLDGEMCYDAGRRQGRYEAFVEIIKMIKALPIENIPVKKTGKWKLHINGSGTCNQCGIHQRAVWDYDNWQNYCGHCGCEMIGVERWED